MENYSVDGNRAYMMGDNGGWEEEEYKVTNTKTSREECRGTKSECEQYMKWRNTKPFKLEQVK